MIATLSINHYDFDMQVGLISHGIERFIECRTIMLRMMIVWKELGKSTHSSLTSC
jgi:hypothetical protein